MSTLVKKILKGDPIDVISKFTIEELEEIITYAAEKYYNTAEPVIPDTIYDILIDFLHIKNPKSKVLKNIGAKVTKNKVKLDYWLGSMNKIKPDSNQLITWTKKYKPPYILSDKLDGISALLTYNYDGKVQIFTRGTAAEGMDITKLIKYLDLPDYNKVLTYCQKNKINGDKNLIAFRGELIIKEEIFQKNWFGTFKNGRNCVAGLVNSKRINPSLANDTDLVLYEIIEPLFLIDKQINIIKDIGFKVVNNKTINQVLSYEYLSNYLKERRLKGNYQIDGIIVYSCCKYDRNIDGNPEYAFAFKDILEDQKAKTTILSIEWNISKDGYIIPTLILKPVIIGGVEIKRTTGYNAKFIVDNVLGPGAEIEIIRSGDVIPKVEKVLKPAKSGKPDLPNLKYQWNETKVDIKLVNYETNLKVLIKNIYHFFSKLETKGLGKKNIEKMVEAGFDTIVKFLSADINKLLTVEGFKEKTAENLVEAIKKATTNISLAKLMSASNKLGHGLGEERMKQILTKYPNIISEYKDWTKKDFISKIKEIDGWEDKTATLFVTNFNDFIKFYNSIYKYITIEDNKKYKGKLIDIIIVFTGFRDKKLEKEIENKGGKIGTTITKNTNYLVVKDNDVINNPTTKVIKAKELGITIITKDKLIKLIS
jgi:NAD-dependent DNA ligase